MYVILLVIFTSGVVGVVIDTPAEKLYQVHWQVSDRDNFKFKANAQKDVILLMDDYTDFNVYEILFGGNENTYSCIRMCKDCLCYDRSFVWHSTLAIGLQKCFWILWNLTSLSYGTGLNIGENAIYRYVNSSKILRTKRIFISTWFGSRGIWEIPDYLTFVTKSNLQNITIYWDVAGVSSALCSIEACARVDIIFTTSLANVYYKVALGDCSNQCTTIQKVISNNVSTVKANLNPLECSRYGDVWISWETKRLVVGTGRVLHQDVFISMDNIQNDAIVERMQIQSSLSAKWKIDVYGCEFDSWQAWKNEVTSNRFKTRRRICHCKRPSSHPTSFDGDFHCDGESEDKLEESIKRYIWRNAGNIYSTTLAKNVITNISKIRCGVACGLRDRCSIFSYTKINTACWLYDVQHFDTHDFVENENFRTYVILN
ncbi:uncharacterized protein LOC126829588 [Patella vulgata]|uniref:uncharacterized protein LOC126829588 n=1 Tax=Patella vulgata TaxID=6465 RepID=UPI0024A8CC6E|nr:uncharacterized protein LOC126829588 [Patella vulgata]